VEFFPKTFWESITVCVYNKKVNKSDCMEESEDFTVLMRFTLWSSFTYLCNISHIITCQGNE
jgi:hypothetical protein